MKRVKADSSMALPRSDSRRGSRLLRQMAKRYDLYLIASAGRLVSGLSLWSAIRSQIAFKNFNPAKGILGDWEGFGHFERFFDSYYFWRRCGIRCPSICFPC